MSNFLIKTYSIIHIYNTTRPSYLETKNTDLLTLSSKNLFFYSVPNAEKIVFSNSLLFTQYLKALFAQQSFFLLRLKTNANLFSVAISNYKELKCFLKLLYEFRSYSFFFFYPFIFKTYKISFFKLSQFCNTQNSLIMRSKLSLIFPLISLISQYYFSFFFFFLNNKKNLYLYFKQCFTKSQQ
jgi:hypothetical protein